MHPDFVSAALAASLDYAQNVILLADDEQHYVYANTAASRLLGYSREELLRMTVWDITPAPDLETAKAMWTAFLRDGRQAGEFRVARKDGVVRVFHYSAVANVVPGLHLSDLHDITDLVDAEEAQRRSVQDRELLMREMQHRVGNMLSTTLAVLQGQAARSDSAEVRDVVSRVSTRIRAMAEATRVMHDATAASETVALGPILEEVARTTVATATLEPERVRWTVEAPRCEASWETVGPLALLVGEVLANFLEHSLRRGEELSVALRGEPGDAAVASVEVHLSRPFASDPSTWEPGFGLRLVGRLAAQLGGDVEWIQGDGSAIIRLRLGGC